MTLNPYFINGTSSEQRLIQDLINEQLRMYGQEVVYMPRKFITEKKIIKELLVSRFDDSFHIEAYVSNVQGFGGQGDILSKFGVRSTDELSLIISKERYEDFISPFILNLPNIKLTTRPQEGDLIYFPLDNGLFEIKYVEGKRPFYQLNNLYVYELKCELFEYEDEIIDTSLEEVDNTIKDFGYIATLRMVPSTSQNCIANVNLAEALVTNPSGMSVSKIDIINGGYGYKSTPEIKIDNAPQNGVTATASAVMENRNGILYLKDIFIINPGIGYTVTPKVYIKSSSGSGFIGTCIISSGVLGPINIVNGGSGYSSPPIVSISTSPTGDNAEALAIVSTGSSSVTSIRYVNVGSGYLVPPEITISPSVGISSGNYIYNEIITGSSSGTKAYVKDWSGTERILKVSIIDGNFALGENIVGSSGAIYRLLSVEKDDIYDPYESNSEIQEESDQILDFSEINPFGEF